MLDVWSNSQGRFFLPNLKDWDSKTGYSLELSDHTDVEGNRRKRDALQLASEHDIDLATAYQIVDGKFTLEEALRRKEVRTFTTQRRNEDKSENR